MATNNNNIDEPRTTALKRQVQILIAAIERLTKQNYDLEEQLRRRNAGPNNHGEEQEGTSVERRDQEGPEDSNTLSRQERQDTSRPSIADMASPYMVAKMHMMKEQMDFMMNAFRGRVSNDLDELVHQTDSPFTTLVTSFPLWPKFRMP